MANLFFRRITGIAFREWSKEHCLHLLTSQEKQEKLGVNIARYVLIHKFGYSPITLDEIKKSGPTSPSVSCMM